MAGTPDQSQNLHVLEHLANPPGPAACKFNILVLNLHTGRYTQPFGPGPARPPRQACFPPLGSVGVYPYVDHQSVTFRTRGISNLFFIVSVMFPEKYYQTFVQYGIKK